MAKKRVPIPKAVAAKVLFASDRTCCVCRVGGKRIQIHHIDDDPSNNVTSNLSVLCFECHGDTQTTGGFGRQLDAEQVRLYRDDWHNIVAEKRVQDYRETRDKATSERSQVRYLASLIETLREKQDYITLAQVYDDMGNEDLRDKYVEMALAADSSDWTVIYLRGMQERPDLVPNDVAERRLAEQSSEADWSQRARTLIKLGRYVEATHDYVKGVLQDFEEENLFAAAFYLKELLESDLVQRLFEHALQDFTDEGDLWWQVRCLQELGWDSELKDLLLANEEEIRASKSPMLMTLLMYAKGDIEGAEKLSLKQQASKVYIGEAVAFLDQENGVEESSGEA